MIKMEDIEKVLEIKDRLNAIQYGTTVFTREGVVIQVPKEFREELDRARLEKLDLLSLFGTFLAR